MLLAAFAVIYPPDLGHGFVRDDFGWIVDSHVESPVDLVRLFTHQPGFYRPLVSLTFSIDGAIWRLNPFGYALTNVILFVIAGGLLYRLARTLTLPTSAALVAVGVWAFDIHAPRMALLWISGRTALALSIFTLATAGAFLRRRYRTAGVFCLLALLSKEEAALLPAILTLFAWVDHPPSASLGPTGRRRDGRAALKATWPMWLALAIYVVLRINSGAFGPTNLPPHYPVVDSLAALMRNVGEYAVRAGLIGAIVVLVLTLAVRPSVSLEQNERRAIMLGALSIAGFFAVTVFAANRSDLYALTPSLGCALVAAAFASNAWRGNPRRFRIASTGLVLAVVVLIPVYWQRDRRWVQPANVSAYVLRTLQAETAAAPQGRIVLLDDVSMRYGLESAFGTMFPAAVRLFKGAGWSGELKRGGEDCEAAPAEAGGDVFVFREGRLSRCEAP